MTHTRTHRTKIKWVLPMYLKFNMTRDGQNTSSKSKEDRSRWLHLQSRVLLQLINHSRNAWVFFRNGRQCISLSSAPFIKEISIVLGHIFYEYWTNANNKFMSNCYGELLGTWIKLKFTFEKFYTLTVQNILNKYNYLRNTPCFLKYD